MTYRSDVVGSLLRPEYLKEARRKRESGELSHAEFKKIEDRVRKELGLSREAAEVATPV